MKKILSLVLATMLIFSLGAVNVSFAETVTIEADYVPGEKPANAMASANGWRFTNVGANNALSQNVRTYTRSTKKTEAYFESYEGSDKFTWAEYIRYSDASATDNENTRNPVGHDLKFSDTNVFEANTLVAGQKYVFQADVRLPDTTKNAKEVDNSVTSATFAAGISREGQPSDNVSPYGGGMKEWTINSKELTTVSGILSAPAELTSGANYYISLGIPKSEQTNGAAVVIDLTKNGIYFAKETVYDISVTATEGGTGFVAGAGLQTKVKAALLNQIGTEMPAAADEFTWYAVNEAKTETVDGITVVADADTSTATVKVADGVAAGNYYIVAKSNTNDWYKSLAIKVYAKEEIPAEGFSADNSVKLPANILKGSGSANGYQGVGANSSAKTFANYLSANNIIRYEFVRQASGNENSRRVEGMDIQVKNSSGSIDVNGGMQEFFKPNTSYIFWANVRLSDKTNYTDETGTAETSVPFAAGLSLNSSPVGTAENYDVVQEITSTTLTKFKAKVTTPNFTPNANGQNYYQLSIGLPDSYTTAGGAVVIDLNSNADYPYFAPEAAYKITANIAENESATVLAGQHSEIKVEASVVNQLEEPMQSAEGFAWFAVNETKTAAANGIAVIPEGDGSTATVVVAPNAKPGTYYAVAKDRNTGIYNSVEIKVDGLAVTGLKTVVNATSVDVDAVITNPAGGFAEDSDVYVAVYGANNVLKKVVKLDKTYNANLTIDETIETGDSDIKTLKIFIWEKGSLQPQVEVTDKDLTVA